MSVKKNQAYIGRFAPSPTGPLHFGSLIAAVGSYCCAQSQRGKWLVRMEDLDPPREMAGAANDILKTLEVFGFEWDDEILFQSTRSEAYQAALKKFHEQQLTYPCVCSRKTLIDSGHQNEFGLVYPGTCRNAKIYTENNDHCIRVRTHNNTIIFNDALQGRYAQALESDVGDFQLFRRDGLFAYHLAVVIDDADQNITHIVRGYDLLDSTPRQIYIQQLLGLPTPSYMHLPIVVNKDGDKLSKQTFAEAIKVSSASKWLWHAFNFLGQQPPKELMNANKDEIWQWGMEHWCVGKIPKQSKIQYDLDCFGN